MITDNKNVSYILYKHSLQIFTKVLESGNNCIKKTALASKPTLINSVCRVGLIL